MDKAKDGRRSKQDALFRWVQLLLDDKTIDNTECLFDGKILLKIISLVDKDVWSAEYTDDASGRLECILSYLEGIYGGLRNATSKTAILANDPVETVKLLVVILVAAVNSGNVSLFVESIMKLSTTDQMTIMSIISPINEGIADKGLQELLQEVLCNAVSTEDENMTKSPTSFIFSPGISTRSPCPSFIGSPAVSSMLNTSYTSSVGADSPFKILSSPRVISKRELFEKNKLNVRIRRLESHLSTQKHIIDELEQNLDESHKKNEMLENINTELKNRVKVLSLAQSETDSIKMLKAKLETKDSDLRRAKERLGKTLEDNALLNKEIDMLQRQLGTEKEEAVIKLRKMNEKCDQLQSSEDTLRVKNAELLNSIEIREDECRRAVEEKEQQCKELLDHVEVLKEQLTTCKNNEENFGDDQQCLQNELKTVELEESVKKANEELQLCKEKYESSTKFVFELKNQLNKSQSTLACTSKDLEAAKADLLDLKQTFENESLLAKNREQKLLSQVADLKLAKGDLEVKIISLEDDHYILKREKEEMVISCAKEKNNLERLIHEQQLKLTTKEIQFSDLQLQKDNLEKLSKERCDEFKTKLRKLEERHEVERYQLNESLQKKICELKQVVSEKAAEISGLNESYDNLLKTKRVDDEIFVSRIAALIEERNNAVGVLTAEMNDKINDIAKEKQLIESELGEISYQKANADNENVRLSSKINACEAKLHEVTKMLDVAVLEKEKQASSATALERELQICRDTMEADKAEIDDLKFQNFTENEKVQRLESDLEETESQRLVLKQKTDDLQMIIESLNSEIEVHSQTIECKQTEINSKETKVDDILKAKSLMESEFETNIGKLRSEIEVISKEKATLEEKLCTFEKECQDLKIKYTEVEILAEEEISDVKNTVAKLTEEKSIIESANGKMKLELESVKEVLVESRKEITSLNSQKSEIKAMSMKKVEDYSQQLHESEEARKDLELSVNHLKKEISDIQELAAKMKDEFEERLEVKENICAEVNAKNCELVRKIEEVNRLIGEKQGKFSSPGQQFENLQLSCEDVIVCEAKQVGDTETLGKNVRENRVCEIESFEKKIYGLLHENEKLKAESAQYEKETACLKTTIKDLEESVEKQILIKEKIDMDFQEEKKKLIAENTNVKKEWQESSAKEEELKVNINKLQYELEAKMNEMEAEFKMKTDKLEEDLTASENQLEVIQSQSQKTMKDLQLREAKYAMIETTNYELMQRIKEANKLIKEKNEKLDITEQAAGLKPDDDDEEMVLLKTEGINDVESLQQPSSISEDGVSTLNFFEKELHSLLKENTNLKAETTQHEQERSCLNAKIKELEEFIGHQKQANEKIANDFEKEKKVLIAQNEDVKKSWEESNLKIDALKSHLKEVKSILQNELESKVDEIETEFHMKMMKLQEDLTTSENQWKVIQSQLQKTMEGLQLREAKYAVIETTNYELMERFKEANTLIEKINEKRDKTEKATGLKPEDEGVVMVKTDGVYDMESLQQPNSISENGVSVLNFFEKGLHSLLKGYTSLKAETNQYEQNRSCLDAKIKELEEFIEHQKQANEKIAFDFEEEKKQLIAENEDVKKGWEESSIKIDALKSHLKEVDTILKKELESKVSEMEMQFQMKVEKLQEDLTTSENQLEVIQNQLQKTMKGLLVKEAKYAVIEKTNYELMQRIKEANQLIEKIHEKRDSTEQAPGLKPEDGGMALLETEDVCDVESLQQPNSISEDCVSVLNSFETGLHSLLKKNTSLKDETTQYEQERSCLNAKIKELEEFIGHQKRANEKIANDFEEEKKDLIAQNEDVKKGWEESNLKIDALKSHLKEVDTILKKELESKVCEMETQFQMKVEKLQGDLTTSENQLKVIESQLQKTIKGLQLREANYAVIKTTNYELMQRVKEASKLIEKFHEKGDSTEKAPCLKPEAVEVVLLKTEGINDVESLQQPNSISEDGVSMFNFFEKGLHSLLKDNTNLKAETTQYVQGRACLDAKIKELEEFIEHQKQANEKIAFDFEEEKKDLIAQNEDIKKDLEESNLKLQEDLTTSEHQLQTVKDESQEAINDLQQKLEEMSNDKCNKESDLLAYKTRLADIEGSMKTLERKTEVMKNKLRSDMVQLMKDYEEKESAFDEERRMLQSVADHAEKDLFESKQNVETYKERIKSLETELEKKKSELRDAKLSRQGSAEQVKKIGSPSNNSGSGEGNQKCATSSQTSLVNGNKTRDIANLSFDDQSTLVCDDLTIRRSPSWRSLDLNAEDTFGGSITSLESVGSIDSNFSRSRSLRRQSGIIGGPGRRRSLLYMAGKTPPDRRTTLSVPMPRIPACQMEDEPDILESKEFDEDLYRMNELKRRNTLCLPHLKSSYPLEVLATDTTKNTRDPDYELSVRNSLDESRKRKCDKVFTISPPKRNPANASSWKLNKDPAKFTVKSDSSIITRSMISEGSKMIWGDSSKIKDDSQNDTIVDPRRESIAFSIDFDEPNKKLKPRASLRRSHGSARLIPAESKESISASKEDISAKAVESNMKASKMKSSSMSIRGKENKGPNGNVRGSLTPLKRSQSDKTSLKSRTSNFRKSLRKSISKVRGGKPAV